MIDNNTRYQALSTGLTVISYIQSLHYSVGDTDLKLFDRHIRSTFLRTTTLMASHDNLPYWQVNVPEHKRAAQCPVYLLGISDKDRDIISTPDSEYTPQTWDQVSSFVKLNNLELFQRWPSELRRYRAYMHKIKTTYGSVTRFILNERLQWETPVVPYGSPFEFKDDVKILYNDWPYGIDPRIVHLVVWTKFCIDEDPVTGDLTDRAREQVDTFVTRTFQSQVSPENVRAIFILSRGNEC